MLTLDNIPYEEEVVEKEADDGAISLHALRGLVNSKTIKVEGKARNHKLMVLIDSGSMHSFIDEKQRRSWGV